MTKYLTLATVLTLAAPVQAQTMTGEQVYKMRCQACHTVKAGAPGMVGPNLASVVGRKAATGKFTYSAALIASKLKWTPATLDTFLTSPGKMVPGTRMVISVSDPAQRAALITWLAKAK
ncbi:MAG: hypothetical protein RL367_905 [Pseudomonadota bacterium]|jgi:cytochrome c